MAAWDNQDKGSPTKVIGRMGHSENLSVVSTPEIPASHKNSQGPQRWLCECGEENMWINARCWSCDKQQGVSAPECVVCREYGWSQGCEFCPKVSTTPAQEIPATASEPFPIEVWTFFSDSDLDQLVVDACAEMGRRELERGRKLKPCRFCDSTRAAKFEDSDICSDKDACMKRIHHA